MKQAMRAAVVVSGALLVGRAAGAEVVSLEPVRDNTLCEDGFGALSNGSGRHLFAGRTGLSDSRRRGLLAFDVAGNVPQGSVVTSVKLTLHMSRTLAAPHTVELRKVSSDWGEGASDAALEEGGCTASAAGDATWIHTFFDTSFWGAAGGDFSGVASASRAVGTVGSYEWGSTAQMVADVQGWLDSPADNFGWVLLGNEATPSTTKRFDSRDHPDPSVRPILTVTYSTDYACEMTLSYADSTSTLTMGFEIGTPVPVTWNVWMSLGTGMFPFWSLGIPVVQPPVSFALPIPGFPRVGTIGFVQTLTGPGGIVCSDAKLVPTGTN
jgi:hypothetical protein